MWFSCKSEPWSFHLSTGILWKLAGRTLKLLYFILFCPEPATGDKPVKKMQPEAEAPVASGNLSETQKALISEIMETWKSKTPIVMKKVGPSHLDCWQSYSWCTFLSSGPCFQQEWPDDPSEAPEEEPAQAGHRHHPRAAQRGVRVSCDKGKTSFFSMTVEFFKYSILNCRMNLTAPPNRTEKSPCSTKNRFEIT